MTNPNVTEGIGSAERLKFQNQSVRSFYWDEQWFYVFHPPMPTQHGKQLQQYFDEMMGLEKEKYRLREE